MIFIIILLIAFSADSSFSSPQPDFNTIKSPWQRPSMLKMLKVLSTQTENQLPAFSGRIISGMSADIGQFPFMIFLMITDLANETMGCGGSLIKMDWILTAAHCLQDQFYGYAFAGVVDLQNGSIAWKGFFDRSQMFIHEHFTMENYFDNDIALIKLNKNIPCSKNVGIVDLPCYCDGLYDLDGIQVTTMGFGTTNGNVSMVNLKMNYAVMEVMPVCQCKKFFPFPIFDSMICTSTGSGMSSW